MTSTAQKTLVTPTAPPSLPRMAQEYDGTYPGVSMFNLVTTHTEWDIGAQKKWHDSAIHADQVIFNGSGNGFTVQFRSAKLWNPQRGRELNFDSSITVTFKPTGMEGCPTTIIKCSDGTCEGHSGFRHVTEHGRDGNRYVDASMTMNGEVEYLLEARKKADRTGRYDRRTITNMVGSQMWLARVALWFSVDWERSELKPLPSLEDVSKKYAVAMHERRRRWGNLYVGGGF